MKVLTSQYNSSISFKANKTDKAKTETVAVLGSSTDSNYISKYMDLCSEVTKNLILADKNILHGCGRSGIMGRAYKTAQKYSKIDKDGKPEQNLAIIMNPLWGDEDLGNCIPVKTVNSEAERIEEFAKAADYFVIFPGSATTLQEAATLIAKNNYSKPEQRKPIILVGKDYFKGLTEQYNTLYKEGLLKDPPEKLFITVDTKQEILNKILNNPYSPAGTKN